ncbi:hypothetical protein C1T17_14395 [Sphingobium sp. SCG-1]|nr:hypothetical protein C1T17_14395 [Sphingobium sp. SCG-1]
MHEVQIVNVSPLGLMGRTQSTIAAGEKLLFELPHIRRAEAVARWVEDGRVGVEFTKPIESDHYTMMLAFMPKRQMQW